MQLNNKLTYIHTYTQVSRTTFLFLFSYDVSDAKSGDYKIFNSVQGQVSPSSLYSQQVPCFASLSYLNADQKPCYAPAFFRIPQGQSKHVSLLFHVAATTGTGDMMRLFIRDGS